MSSDGDLPFKKGAWFGFSPWFKGNEFTLWSEESIYSASGDVKEFFSCGVFKKQLPVLLQLRDDLREHGFKPEATWIV